MRFTIGSGDLAVTLEARDVVDTKVEPLRYRYECLALPGAARATKSAGRPRKPIVDDVQPEMVGATEKRVPLGGGRSDAVIVVSAPTGPALKFVSILEGELRRVYLKIENVEGSELAASSYMVHVNLPPGADAAEHPERRAGQISMFGVPEASRGDERHGGGGLTFSFEITAVARGLEDAGDWDPKRLRVTFTPVRRKGSDAQGDADPHEGGVSVGRVSLFYT
jgi:tyrosinase